MAWHSALEQAIGSANRLLQPNREFGVPLVEIESRLRVRDERLCGTYI
jgi:hypothetical protein